MKSINPKGHISPNQETKESYETSPAPVPVHNGYSRLKHVYIFTVGNSKQLNSSLSFIRLSSVAEAIELWSW